MLYRLLTHEQADITKRHIVVSLSNEGFYGPLLRAHGVELHCLGMRRPLDLLPSFVRLVRLMQRLRPDVVQTWLYHGDLLGGLAAKLSGSPPVVWGIHTVHLDPRSSLITKSIRRICAWTSSWLPTAIVCVANAAADSHANLGYRRSRMVVIPNGFDLPPLETLQDHATLLRTNLGFAASDRIIGCVGRFHPDKDYGTFLSAAMLVARNHVNVRFMMVGRGLTVDNPELTAWIEKFELTKHVVTLGPRMDVTTCLLAMDIFCLPSRTEAFPMALGEAMAAGRPVITTDVGDAALLVADCGLIVPAEHPSKLAEGLTKLLSLPKDRLTALGLAGRDRVASQFAMTTTMSRLLSLYEDILNRRTPTSAH